MPNQQVKKPVLRAHLPDARRAEILYVTHHAELKAFLAKRAQAPELVDELLHELYLRLLQVQDLDAIDNPSAYLKRMAKHLLVDNKHRMERQTQMLVNQSVEQLQCLDPSPLDAVADAQRLALCAQALEELPEAWRTAFLMNRLEGDSHQRIADRMGRSKSWVEKVIAQTLLYCQERLERLDQFP